LKIDAKLDCDVDAEEAADMMDRREGGAAGIIDDDG